MSGSSIGGVVGAGIGFLIAGPAGIKWGFEIGSILGGIVDPQKIEGPRLSDVQRQTAQEGVPIPFGYGTHPRPTQIIWAGNVKEHKQKSGGKGGPQQVTYTYTRSYAIACGKGPANVVMVWENGKLVYDITAGSVTTAQNAKFLEDCTFYPGDETQNVDPTIEAEVGVNMTGPNRGLSYFVIANRDLTDTRGAVPQYRVVVQTCGTITDNSGTLLDMGPAFYYPLQTDYEDKTGNLLDLVPAGSGTTLGGSGVQFPSITGHATVVEGDGFGGSSNATLLVKCTLDNVIGGSVIKNILSHVNNGILGYYSWSVHLAGSNKLTPRIGIDNAGGAGQVVTAGFEVSAGQTFVMGFRKTGTLLELLFDVEVVSTGLTSGGSFGGGSAAFTAGGGNFFPSSYGLVGSVGEAVGFTRALTDEEIRTASFRMGLIPSGYIAVPDVPGAYVDEEGNLVTAMVASESISDCTETLGDIVTDLCEQAGLEPDEYDVSELTDPVKGYPCATESSAQGFIEPLTQAFFFDRGEWDKKVRFIKRGGASVAALDPDDLLAADGAVIVQTRVQEVELLRKVNVMSVDPSAEYNMTKQSAERRVGTIEARGESTAEIPLVLETDDAAQIADKRLKVAWAETDKFQTGVSLAYSYLTPTDVVTLTDKNGAAHRIRLQAQNEEGGRIVIEEAMKDRASTYGSNAVGVVNPNTPSNIPSPIGPTLFAAMALPQLRSQDNTPGLYIGACGMLDGWAGAQILLSVDGGLSYTVAMTITEPTTMGSLTADEDSNGEPLQVRVFGGELESATTAQVDLGANWSGIQTAGVAEIVAYETATPTSANTYDLTDVTRGLEDTVIASHTAGDTFMDLSSAYFLPINQDFAGSTLYFKAVALGVSADAVDPVAVAWDGVTYVLDGGGA